MRILLYNPSNEVTRNFMPHLWMFLLQTLTPDPHEVILVDGNVRPMSPEAMARFVREEKIDLAGIGAMTRMAAQAYRMADAIRSQGIPVVMGGPHVTEVPGEPLGQEGEPRHADAVALGEADETWPRIVCDAAAGRLEEIYAPVDASGKERKPSLANYPSIAWDRLDLEQFNLMAKVPSWGRSLLAHTGHDWKSFYMVPIETGRGCPYGCDFCTVTGFFGDSIRFRSNESVVAEMLLLKDRARREGGRVGVFFIDDNFAIHIKRAKSLLRDIIASRAQLPWTAQISINLLRDDEFLDLIAESGGRWIFVGLESLDPANLKDVNKGFNRPQDYRATLERLAERGLYAITSFIFGMDGDRAGTARRTLDAIASWPPGLPVFGLLTPYPSTPLYDRLLAQGRLTRPRHWLDFRPFRMAFRPTHLEPEQAEAEVRQAWTEAYSRASVAAAVRRLADRPLADQITMFVGRLVFRGIYFPQRSRWHWLWLLFRHGRTLLGILWHASRVRRKGASLPTSDHNAAAPRPNPAEPSGLL